MNSLITEFNIIYLDIDTDRPMINTNQVMSITQKSIQLISKHINSSMHLKSLSVCVCVFELFCIVCMHCQVLFSFISPCSDSRAGNRVFVFIGSNTGSLSHILNSLPLCCRIPISMLMLSANHSC